MFATEIGAESLRLRMDRMTPEWVARGHAAGLEVYVYTVNTPEELRKMIEAGVDGVFTNYPDIIYKGVR